MGINIDIPSYLQSFTNGAELVEVNGGTVGECLQELVDKFPGIKKTLLTENGDLHGYVALFINETDAYPDELTKPVNDGDHLHIIYVIGGG